MLLPDDADREKLNAKVEHGALKVNIPKIVKVQPNEAHKVIEIKYFWFYKSLKSRLESTRWLFLFLAKYRFIVYLLKIISRNTCKFRKYA